ncbi:MAG: polysaccharide deacetylase family protein [Candidatus Promineifilaceae bacterium]
MSNPALKRLGFSDNDRVFIFHADDIGLNYASVEAYRDLLAHSPLSSAAVMTPCPWFPAAAQLFREQTAHPRLDVGIHLTLTSEWDKCRWRPISTDEPSSGLLDEEGYFPRTTAAVQANACVEVVEKELRAQIEHAISAEINPTHIDSHMGTLMHPNFLPIYMRLGLEYQLPAFNERLTIERICSAGFAQSCAEQLVAKLEKVEQQGMIFFDKTYMLPLNSHQSLEARLAYATDILNSAEPGLYYFLIHPCIDTPTLRSLARDWEARVGDYNLFMSKQWHAAIDASGVKVIGMQALRDALRAKVGS